VAELLKHGQRRVDDAWAWTVGAANLVFDCFDDLVTVPRPLGNEVENKQAKVAMSEEAAEAASATTVLSGAELKVVVAMLPVGKPAVPV